MYSGRSGAYLFTVYRYSYSLCYKVLRISLKMVTCLFQKLTREAKWEAQPVQSYKSGSSWRGQQRTCDTEQVRGTAGYLPCLRLKKTEKVLSNFCAASYRSVQRSGQLRQPPPFLKSRRLKGAPTYASVTAPPQGMVFSSIQK